jgi:hypothetical protein
MRWCYISYAVREVAVETVGYSQREVADAGRNGGAVPDCLQREHLRLQRLIRTEQPAQPQRAPS